MATYTSVNEIDLDQISACYSLTNLQLEPIAGGAANSSFTATASQGKYILTVLDNHDYSSANLLASQTNALYQVGMPTSRVVKTIEDSLICHIQGQSIMLREFVEGNVIDPIPDSLLPEVGRQLAHLHEFSPSTVPGVLPKARRLSLEQESQVSTFLDKDFVTWIQKRLDTFHQREAEEINETYVLCHGDLFSDNIIVGKDGQITIIDWECISLDSSLFDLGMTIVGLANINNCLDHSRAQQIISGYTSVRPLAVRSLARLADEIEYAAIVIAFHRYYRHNIQFPDSRKAHSYQELIVFADSISDFTICQ